jgi:putative ABC transport system permease protein
LAAGNILRLKRQSFTVLLSLGLALTLFVAIALIEDNIKNRIAEDIPDDAPAFFFIDIQKSQMEGLRALLGEIETVSDLREVPNLRGRIEAVNGIDAQDALVDPSEGWLLRGDRGFTYLSELPDYSELLEGEWWDASYNDPQRPIISVVEDVARAFDVGVGDQLTLNILGRAITAEIVNVRSVDWSTMTINYAITFAPGVLDNAPHSFLATVQAAPEQESEVLRRVAIAYPNISAIAVRDALNTVSDVLTKIAWAVRGIAGLALVTGIMVLMSSLLSSLRQRRYETTLMKVLGAQKKDIIRVTLLEFLLLGGGAMFIALVSGAATAYWVITFIMDFPWQFDAVSMLSVSFVAMGVTGLGAVWAMRKAMNVSACEYLRNE